MRQHSAATHARHSSLGRPALAESTQCGLKLGRPHAPSSEGVMALGQLEPALHPLQVCLSPPPPARRRGVQAH